MSKMFRYRSTTKRYKNTPKLDACAFCDDSQRAPTILETTHCLVIENMFPYDIWEHQDVTEHYLVVPKRHVKSLSELQPHEQTEVLELICQYEAENFNIYARGANSSNRSIAQHQHTHLIKTREHKAARGTIYLEKPYVLLKF